MTTQTNVIKNAFNLTLIKNSMEDHNGSGRGIMLGLIGTLRSIGLSTKEISHNQWVVTYITDITTNVANIDFESDMLTYTTVDNETFEADSVTKVCSAENLWKLLIGMEYGYAKSLV